MGPKAAGEQLDEALDRLVGKVDTGLSFGHRFAPVPGGHLYPMVTRTAAAGNGRWPGEDRPEGPVCAAPQWPMPRRSRYTLRAMLTAGAIAEDVKAGRRTARSVIEESLGAIARLDGELHAWVHVDRDGALAAADALARRTPGRDTQLWGVPIGVKDIIDVAGMPTTAGAAAFAHRMPEYTSDAVVQLRMAGAVVVGKTATTEFAYLDPAETRNPWNLEHTPGGSSSGSAVAVATGMVPIALGSQTVGSVLRPAAYCGIVGFKATYGTVPSDSVVPLAWSFDHVGIFARTVEDVRLVLSVYEGPPGPGAPGDRVAGVPRSFFADRASPAMLEAFDGVVELLAREGVQVVEIEIPAVEEWFAVGRTVLGAEAAAYHRDLFAEHEEEYRPEIRSLIAAGRLIPATEYVLAKRVLDDLRSEVEEHFRRVDFLVLPTAPGPAPEGLASTGDSSFCAPASFMGLPAISLPCGLDEHGLPLGVQIVGDSRQDWELLEFATGLERAIGFEAKPAICAD
ncbi:MAG: amidase [Dehalococcoidia bacterium]